MEIIFVTGNNRKIAEAKLACKPAGIEIIPKQVDIQEIQSSFPRDVSLDKATKAFGVLDKPLVVTDTFWRIPSLNGFPGAYMSDVVDWFKEDDFIALMQNKKDMSIYFSENITFIDSNGVKTFQKEFEGTIVLEPRGTGNSLENVAEFDGVTLGERREQGGFSHKPEDYVWNNFVKWYLARA